MIKGTRALLYGRFSTDMQNERSIDDQYLLCQRLADRESLKVTHKICDRAKTSATLDDREGIAGVMALAKKSGFDVLVVESLDRLSRAKSDLDFLYDFCTHYKIRILTLSEGWVSEIQASLRGIMGSMYLRDLGDKVRRGFAGRVDSGKLPPGAPAYGYRRIKSLDKTPAETIINDDEAKIVARIFTEYAQGKSPGEITDRLTAEGVPAPRGEMWDRFTLISGGPGGLIGNTLYKGVYTWGRRKNVRDPETKRKCRERLPESEWITKPMPELRIVSDKLWETANAMRRSKAVRKGRGNNSVSPRKQYLLAGMLRCGVCSGPMRITHNNGKSSRVSCATAFTQRACEHRKSYDVSKIETEVLERMRTELTDPARLIEATLKTAAEWSAQAKQNRAEKMTATKEIARLTLQIERLVLAIQKSDGGVEELAAAIPALRNKRESLREKLRVIEAESNVVEFHPGLMDAYKETIEALYASLTADDVTVAERDEARLHFRAIMDSIHVHPTAWGKQYDFSVYGRMGAIMGGAKLFPTSMSREEMLAAEGLSNCVSVYPAKAGFTPTHNGNVVFFGRWGGGGTRRAA